MGDNFGQSLKLAQATLAAAARAGDMPGILPKIAINGKS